MLAGMEAPSLRDLTRDWTAHGGNDPGRNPLVAHLLHTPVLREFSEGDVLSSEERLRHPLWNEFYLRIDIPHYCVCPIWRDADGCLVAVQLSRTTGQGEIPEGERKIFRRLARPWRDAAMISRTLKNEGARVLAGALDTLSIAALFLDGLGRVVAMSEAAENILRTGEFLQLKSGTLKARCDDAEAALASAVQCSVGSFEDGGGAATAKLRGLKGGVVTLRAHPLPRENVIAFGAAAVVVVENASDDGIVQSGGLEGFGLTKTEIEIATAVLRGRRVRTIARDRKVAYETVRSQIKSIYSKAGVHSRAEFMSQRKA